MAEKVDIFICGSGSAGLCAAAWLAKCGVRCKIVDSRSGPLERGQADGVQCRTVEVFDSFGIAEELLREAYHVLEVTFWGSDGTGVSRTKRTPDTTPGLSHQPHVILNQARVNGLLLDAMRRFNGQAVDYGYAVKSVQVDVRNSSGADAYPVTVVTEKEGKEKIFQAKYVLGCDGAHSAVRKSLGFKMVGDSTDVVWGVMDVYPQTTFPDIRKKVVLQSHAGTLMIIPREGGSLVRFYIELPDGTKAKDVTRDDLCLKAREIFHPYKMNFGGFFWWSAYPIGQRLADHFTKDYRIFLTGDACHTHSPKAGQGMNTSLQDGYNIGWKLAAVLKGQVHHDVLKSYVLERGKVAADLIAFDRELTKILHSKTANGDLEQDFSDHFIKSGKYMAGLTATYEDSSITRAQWSTQSLATNLKVGMRFPSTQVVRFGDAKAMHLVKALPADGRWRIVIFAGDIRCEISAQRLQKLANYLDTKDGPIRMCTPIDQHIDSFIEPIVVLSGERVKTEQELIPDFFWPVTGEWGMRDLHKTYIDDESYNSGHGHAYEFYGVDPLQGAVIIVRPDQYVSMVLPLEENDDHEHRVIGDFFSRFCTQFLEGSRGGS